jgi:hypothetical protein
MIFMVSMNLEALKRRLKTTSKVRSYIRKVRSVMSMATTWATWTSTESGTWTSETSLTTTTPSHHLKKVNAYPLTQDSEMIVTS